MKPHPAGNRIVMFDVDALVTADENGVDVSIARHASIEVDGSATSPPTASTVMVNTWQANLAAVKVFRYLNFKIARPDSVVYTVATWV